MNKLLQDKTFTRLLRKKQRLERVSMLVPFIGVSSLFVFVYFFTKQYILVSLIILIAVLILIILNYLFEGHLSDKIDEVYVELNKHFQSYIVPRLLERDNPMITFDPSRAITAQEIDELEVFNCYTRYKVRFHFDITNSNYTLAFDELVFSGLVQYNTKGHKEVSPDIDRYLNYHVYRVMLPKPLPIRGMVILGHFKELALRNIQSLNAFDFYPLKYGLDEEDPLLLYVEEGATAETLLQTEYVNLYKDLFATNLPIIVDLNGHRLTIIFEEYANLINTPHSKRFTVEKLFYEYRQEKNIVRQIIRFFAR
ncbi:MAG TPA: hypothetical protein VIK63_03465 [Haloplasmataceae bacterium]